MRSPILEPLIFQLLKPQTPPVLILSLPRSGSSWVGDTLSHAKNALYLYEPLTNSVRADPILAEQTYKGIDPATPPANYQHLADLAFSGRPYFSPLSVRYPKQWRFWSRPFRRVVIKEVNLAAGTWLVQRYRPHVVLLVRHPADVLLSFRRLGWWSSASETISDFGYNQGAKLQALYQVLQTYSDHCIVLYEDLCMQPIQQFQRLFKFAQLNWSSATERLVRERSAGGDRSQSYDTSRNSLQMISAWRSQLSADDAQALRTAFSAYDLPWYQSDTDW